MFETLVDLAETSARRFADRELFGERRTDGWHWRTYREVFRAVDELRGGLAALGVGPGDRVAIVSRNSAEWAIAAYATYGLGATFVPMYEAQRPDEWEFILRDCAASVVFGRTPEIVAKLEAMRGSLPALRHVITIADERVQERGARLGEEARIDEGEGGGSHSFAELQQLGREHPTPSVHPDPESIAGFVYTSGTTGKPKGAMLSHANLASNIVASTAIFPITADDRTVSFLPWAHVYGQVVELHILISVGASTAFNDKVERLVEDLVEVKPTILVAVPRIFNKIHASVRAQIAGKPRVIQALFTKGLAASIARRRGQKLGLGLRLVLWLADHLVFSKIRKRFGGRLKYAISASATLSHEVGEFVDALGIDVYEGYGLTETSPVVSTNRPGERKLGSIGKPIPGVTVRIDEKRGDTPGEGEIVVYGPNVMKGYHARPDENARAFTADGGLRTGDLGRFDEDGYLFITGRLKEQYKLENGKYVMPAPVEERLQLSPYFLNVMLHGSGKPYNVALVVPDRAKLAHWAAEHGIPEDKLYDAPEVRALLQRELDEHGAELRGYERPKKLVLAPEEFTVDNGMLTPSLKLKRRNVLERYGEAIEALYREPEPTPPKRPQPPVPAPRSI